MRLSTIQYHQRGIDGILQQQSILSKIQNQISSGKKILTPSDDPVGSTKALRLRQEIHSLEQLLKNGDAAQSALEFEDSVLGAINTLLQRVQELTVAGGNGALTDHDRNSIASELSSRFNELVDLANSKGSNGEYLFSGFKGQTKAVEPNGAQQFQFNGDEGQKYIKLGKSTQIPVSDSGKHLFFDIPTATIHSQTTSGIAQVVMPGSGLVPSGTLSTLDSNELILNSILVSPSLDDGISTTDPSASALAISNAINASSLDHGIQAQAQSNEVNLGVYTAAALGANEFTLNGIQVIDPGGTENSLLNTLAGLSEQTGVVASQPLGPGTDILLTAADGKNIQLETAGGATASFAHFDLTGGAQDSVQRSAVELRDQTAFTVGGLSPADVGLTAGTVPVTLNSGSGTISQAVLTASIPDPNESYSIVFNAGGTTFDIVANSNPNVPLEGFNDVAYVNGGSIDFLGIQVSISGVPNAGDVFQVGFEQPPSEDIFSTMQNLIHNLKNNGGDSARLSYELGVALTNLENTQTRILEVRAQVGARLNVIEDQREINHQIEFLAQSNLSQIEDLDYAEAISQLNQQTLTLQAAQQSYVRIQSLSLFNYL